MKLFSDHHNYFPRIVIFLLFSITTVGVCFGETVANGLVGFWPLNETSGVVAHDLSGRGCDGMLHNGPIWVSRETGSALRFDSDNDEVVLNGLDVNRAAGGHNTVTFWMYWDGRSSEMPFGWGNAYDLYFSGNYFGFNTGQGNVYGLYAPQLKREWVHVAAVFYNGVPSSSTVKLYLDGSRQVLTDCLSRKTTYSKTVTTNACISGWGATEGYKFGGMIDDMRIYNRELSADEIVAVMADVNTAIDSDGDGLSDDEEALIGTEPGNPDTDGDGLLDGEEINTYGTDPVDSDTDGDGLNDGDELNSHGTDPMDVDTDGDGIHDGNEIVNGSDPLAFNGNGGIEELVGSWSLNEGSGTVAYDLSGAGPDGVLHNGPIWVSGKLGKALKFDSNNDEVVLDGLLVNTDSGGYNTVTFWMYWKGGSCEMPFGWNGAYDLYFYQNYFGFNTGQGNVFGLYAPQLKNKWVHVAAVFCNGVPSSSTVKLYLDGSEQVLRDCLARKTTSPRTASSKAYISGWGATTGYKFGGMIDDVRIYNRELSKEEIEVVKNGLPRQAANVPPTAVITMDPAGGVAPQAIEFRGDESTDSDGTIVSYAWDFGDGTFGTNVFDYHTYTEAGSYAATLTVEDDDGAVDTASVNVTIAEPEPLPEAPEGVRLNVDTYDPLSLKVRWYEHSDVTEYIVERSENEGPWQAVGHIYDAGMEPTEYIDSMMVDEEAVYQYRIIAKNHVGSSEPSEVVGFNLPVDVGMLRIDSIDYEWQRVDMSWLVSGFDSMDSMILERKQAEGAWQEVGMLSCDPMSNPMYFGDDVPDMDAQYSYRVRVKTMAGYTQPTEEIGFNLPLPLVNLQVVNADLDGIELSWNTSGIVVDRPESCWWLVERAVDEGAWGLLMQAPFESGQEIVSCYDNMLSGMGSYAYRIRLQAQDGISETSEPITVELADSDGDGLLDNEEVMLGTDPQNPDTDGDGLDDGEEFELGTDPLSEDSDGDGMADEWEMLYGLDPMMVDGLNNPDADGYSNLAEYRFGTDPLDSDSDGDGVSDGLKIPKSVDILAGYYVVPLGDLGGTYSYAYGINEKTQVVGYSGKADDTSGAFLYENGQMMELPSLGGANSRAYDINEFSEIAGIAEDSDGNQEAVIFDYIDSVRTLGFSSAEGVTEMARAINDAGQVSGWLQLTNGKHQAFAYTEGVVLNIHDQHGSGYYLITEGQDINNAGHIVIQQQVYESHPFLYDGSFHSISEMSGAYDPSVFMFGMNAHDQCVGYCPVYGRTEGTGYVYDYVEDTVQHIKPFAGVLLEDHPLEKAFAINDQGVIVGVAEAADGEIHGGVVLADTDQFIDLNDLLVDGDGWLIQDVRDINNRCEIVGTGIYNGGERQAILLIPVALDIDDDGMWDQWEVEYGLDPSINDANEDTDNDGLMNIEEFILGMDPTDSDTDDDGISDVDDDMDNDGMPNGWELFNRLDPRVNDSFVNADGDGWSNYAEYKFGTDPQNPDENEDGELDGMEPKTGAVAQCYQMIPLGTLGGSSSQALGINEYDQVVGYSTKADGTTRAFVYTYGEMIELPSLGGPNSYAYDINEVGEIVGQAQGVDGGARAVLYDFTNSVRLLDIPGNPNESAAIAINDAGQLVGWYMFEGSKQAFAFTPNYFDLNAQLFDTGSSGVTIKHKTAVDINNAGQIIGDYPAGYFLSAYLFDGECHKICGFDYEFTEIHGLNNAGMAVGGRSWATPKAFIYDNNASELYPVNSFDQEYGSGSDWADKGARLYAINDRGTAVGSAYCGQSANRHATIVFQGDSMMTDLNTITYPADGYLGWVVTEARDINENGCIIGWASKNGGPEEAVMLVPILLENDIDNDGMPDDWEIENALDPEIHNSLFNTDGDGWSDYAEYKFGTDPNNSDENGDGMPDGLESAVVPVAQKYKVVPLGTLGGLTSYAYAINEQRQIVGCSEKSDGTQGAFVYADGQMMELPSLVGALGSCAYDINEFGEIVGQVNVTETESLAVKYDYMDSIQVLDIPGNPAESVALAINDAGQLVGWFKDGGYKHAFAFSPNYQAFHVSIPEGTYPNDKTANDINNAGEIVGEYPDRYSISAYIYNGEFHHAKGNYLEATYAYGMNNHGRLVGGGPSLTYCAFAYDLYSDYYQSVFAIGQDFVHPSNWQNEGTKLCDVNNAWLMVGSSYAVDGTRHAGLALPYTGKMIDVNAMTWTEQCGWVIHEARGINDEGCIVGWASLNGGPDQAVMLVPSFDNDGDGLMDEEETMYGTDPGNPDTDGDGLNDGDEICINGTDPLDPDSDNDGISDGVEVENGLNPLTDDAIEDPDSDGLNNLEECEQGSDPFVYDTFYGATLIYQSSESLVLQAMNEKCDVVGFSGNAGFVLDDEYRSLPFLPTDINNNDVICGLSTQSIAYSTSVIYEDGTVTDIPMPAPFEVFYAWEINDDGKVIGDDRFMVSPSTMLMYSSDILSVPHQVASFQESRYGSINNMDQLITVVNDGVGESLMICDGVNTSGILVAENSIGSCDNNDQGRVVWSDGTVIKQYANEVVTELAELENNHVMLDEYNRVYVWDSFLLPPEYQTAYHRYVYENGVMKDLYSLILFELSTADHLTPPNAYGQMAVAVQEDGMYNIYILTPVNQDTDSDGLTDYEEMEIGTLLYEADTDGDGVNDGDEVANGTDPLVSDLNIDTDGDGLSDSLEEQLGTDPLNNDTDGDGLSDGDEVLIYQTYALMADSDGDGLDDGREIALGCDPMDAASKPVNLALTAFPYGMHLTNPQVLNDGVMSSYCYHWDRVAFTAWDVGDMRYDLGQDCAISNMKILFYSCDGQGYEYYIQTSSESADGPWTTVYTQLNKMKNWQTMTFDIPVSARYLRLKCTGVYNARKGLAVVEWQVMGCYR